MAPLAESAQTSWPKVTRLRTAEGQPGMKSRANSGNRQVRRPRGPDVEPEGSPTWTPSCDSSTCGLKSSHRFSRYYFSLGRGVAQPGSAPALGAGSPRFKSERPDQATARTTREETERAAELIRSSASAPRCSISVTSIRNRRIEAPGHHWRVVALIVGIARSFGAVFGMLPRSSANAWRMTMTPRSSTALRQDADAGENVSASARFVQ